jgi:hypothetical protein
MKKLVKIVCLFTLAFFLVNNNLFAVDFQIDQGKMRIKLPPGWSDGGIINVENRGKDPVKIRVYIADWVYSAKDGSKKFLPSNSNPLSCADWIKFYPADFTIPARGKQKVNFVVGVPQDATGGHYAVLFFEAETGTIYDQAKGINVKVYHRLASLFYVEPEGTIKKQAQLSDFKIEESQGKIKVDVNLQNTGNVDIPAKGSFDIIDEEGFVLTRGKFDEVYTMSQDKANLTTTTLNPGFSKGKYDLILTFDLDGGVLTEEWQIEVNEKGKIVGVKKVE